LLSGGEGQRVRLGRGICRGAPSLVILDEAFCGLERTRRTAMLLAARKRWKDATLLCITHDIGQTRSFSRVLVIEGGRIVDTWAMTITPAPGNFTMHKIDDYSFAADRAVPLPGKPWIALRIRKV